MVRAAAALIVLGAFSLCHNSLAYADEPTSPDIVLQSTCHSGSQVAFANHPPKIPVLNDKSAAKELAYWNEIKNSEDASLFLVYITNFQNGMFLETAIEKYKHNCGDLTALPGDTLVCKATSAPAVKAPPKKIVFIPPPPPPKKVIHKIHIKIVKLHKPIKIKIKPMPIAPTDPPLPDNFGNSTHGNTSFGGSGQTKGGGCTGRKC